MFDNKKIGKNHRFERELEILFSGLYDTKNRCIYNINSNLLVNYIV